MKKEILLFVLFMCLGSGTAAAQQPKEDVFKGKLFAPNIILEHRENLHLTKEQFTAIRAEVVEVQAGVAEFEWDMQEAYRALMRELDKVPVEEAAVLTHANTALLAENQVKKKQMAMLVRLKNLLNREQIAYLESVAAK